MTTPLLKPSLYEAGGPGATGSASLKGGRCLACGYVFFPLQRYGCEQCGAHGDALAPATLAGTGTLLARATVHMHARPERTAPFVIGTVRLDDGPVVRTLLDASPTAPPSCGTRMRAMLVEVPGTEPAVLVRDLRFAAIDAGPAGASARGGLA
ncbi:Zn-ribbon domain-containing OB-fold protein [Cupriavidus sp. AU9028]|uniref:Zn-ribbon domain-containing OB-fold protein n=1 Tax=Cupriavidus sp. AU9028 TaxID=2871157 RepID=UPI001C9716D1|nr:OB-fold domain-containing protein [Cupriavidus sp. AU9028]MBY4897063.1 OB-fold domain-containing protein [Cupriavidus sp. AU9028]